MKEMYQLPQDERDAYFMAASDLIKIEYDIIEKDYWVVWVLERLFSLDKLKPHLTFKGGTSLSKIFGAIDRFSEDVDLSIERGMFGYAQNNGPEQAPSRKKQQSILDRLARDCSNFVQTTMMADLHEAICAKLGTAEGWKLYVDQEDPDLQTLLFAYPSKISANGYIRQLVKIEIGARAEHWPVGMYPIQSYAKNALQEKIHEPEMFVRVLNAERTFWEKATILHQYAHLPEGKKAPPRISRHFYDFYRLLNSPIKEQALLSSSLLDRVATHKSIYFASGWANYGMARQGTLKLVPPMMIQKELEKDYILMESMFFKEIPDWNSILSAIEQFEHEFNNK